MGTLELYENLEELELKEMITRYENFAEDIQKLIDKGKNNKIFLEKFGDEIIQIKENWEIDIHLIRMELTKRMWGKENA